MGRRVCIPELALAQLGMRYPGNIRLKADMNQHMARQAAQTATPDTALLATPALPASYRSPIPSSSSTQLHLGSTPYRTPSFPMSSPFSSHMIRYTDSPDASCLRDEEDEMEMLDDAERDDMRRSYEEANRLLADLEVDRRRRWGGLSVEDVDHAWCR